jgi:rhodanese-related sulfurtransferase
MKHGPAFLALVEETKSRVKHIGIDEYKRMVEAKSPFLLVDTREESEWMAGHAVGAIHLSKGIIEREIERTVPDKQTCLVLYCGGGYRSVLAADNLQKMGYASPISLDGGWKAWQEAKLPVEKPA